MHFVAYSTGCHVGRDDQGHHFSCLRHHRETVVIDGSLGENLQTSTPARSCRCLVLSKKCWFHGYSFRRGRQRTRSSPHAWRSQRGSHADAAPQERMLTESVLKLQVVRRVQEPRRVCTTARLSWEREHCASLGATSEACRCRAGSLWRKLMSTGSRVLVTAFGAAAATTARGSVLCVQIPDPRGCIPDGSLTGSIVGTKTDEKVCKCGSWADPTDGSAPRFGSAHCRSAGGFRWNVGPQGDRPSPENGGDPRLWLSAGQC